MKTGYFLAILLGIILITGCSKASDPITPVNQNELTIQSLGNLPVMAETLDENGNLTSGSGAMGIFSVTINPDTLSGELVPLREASLDDALEMVDITNFLTLSPCRDCAKLMSVGFNSDGHILVKMGIKHPFEVGNASTPITARNRGDLHVFNVEGTVIFNDSNGTETFPGMSSSIAPPYLINADGYSPYLDIALDAIYPTTATVHPYILHFDDYTAGNFSPVNPMGFASVTTPPPSGNLVMAMGCDYDIQDYIFNISGNASFEFIYAIGCTYAASVEHYSQRFSPEFQIPQHNKKAASEVEIEVVNVSLSPGNTASSAELLVKVLDINHGVEVGSWLDRMKADSSVNSIFVEVPGVTSGMVGGTATLAGGDGRDPLNPLIFKAIFYNDLGAGDGIYSGLVKVLDAYPPGLNTAPILVAIDAIKRVPPGETPFNGLYMLAEFATYMPFNVEISGGNPVASFVTNPVGTPDLELSFLDTVEFTSTSTDPDDPMTPEGQIVSYEWDFVWDGNPLTFSDDTGGMGTGVETHQFTTVGTYQVGLRVSDGGSPSQSSIIFSIQVTVDEWSRDFIIDTNDGRIPKIAEMASGKMVAIWAGADGQGHYSVFDGSWSTPDVYCTTTPNYLSIWGGPGDEVFAGGGCTFYRYVDSTGLWTEADGSVASGVQTHIYADDSGGWGVFLNTSGFFITRCHYNSYPWSGPASFAQAIAWSGNPGGNNRLLGESRVVARNTTGKLFLVFKKDLAIDPYMPPEDYRYLVSATMGVTSQSYTSSLIVEGDNDTLDSVAIACDTSDKLHIVYLSEPDGGGDFSIYYKSSIDNGSTWEEQSAIRITAHEPEHEYISIDTNSRDHLIVTYRVANNISWRYSFDGSSWLATDVVNESFPGAPTHDKEQYMVVDSRDWTHVVWDRCADGAVGHGPIMHRVRAPFD